jgi:hypothetical protein
MSPYPCCRKPQSSTVARHRQLRSTVHVEIDGQD